MFRSISKIVVRPKDSWILPKKNDSFTILLQNFPTTKALVGPMHGLTNVSWSCKNCVKGELYKNHSFTELLKPRWFLHFHIGIVLYFKGIEIIHFDCG